MMITKYEHSCFDVSVADDRLIIDPGSLSKSFDPSGSVAALVISHVHPDHFDEQKVRAIIESSPGIEVFSTDEVAQRLTGLTVTVPELGHIYEVGSLRLEFFGGLHATILPGIPRVQNFGVLVNQEFYYTGDSYTPCLNPHSVLGIVLSAPWMRLAESVDFIRDDSAETIIPCHDGFLNSAGYDLVHGVLRSAVEAVGKNYGLLVTGEGYGTKR